MIIHDTAKQVSYSSNRFRARGLASRSMTSLTSRRGAQAPVTRYANQLPQATQHRVCLPSLQVPCFYTLQISSFHCATYVFFLIGYDDSVLIQTMPLLFVSSENLVFLISVIVPQVPYHFLLSYALPLPIFLLVKLSEQLTKFYLSFCWRNPGVTPKMNFESRNWTNKLKLDLVPVPQNLLINNLKLKCQREKITAQNSNSDKLLASQRCKLNSIEFPAVKGGRQRTV